MRSVPVALVLLGSVLAPLPALHASDKVVVSCPAAKKNQKLLDVYLFEMPKGKLVEGSAGVRGTSWDLASVKVDEGQHLVLDCGYGPLSAAPGTRPESKDIVTKRIPEDAGRCYRALSPVAGRCYAR